MTENVPLLESWKEIAVYLKKDITTVRRWEKAEGLPVHRHPHKTRSSVYAYPSEIDAWRAGRKVVPDPAPIRSLWRWPAFALTMLLCLIMVGNGVRPVAAQQAAAAKAARQLWVTRSGELPQSISSDGRYFSLTDWPDLAVHDLTTGTNRRLTNGSSDGFNEGSVFSSDGRQIAYSWSGTGGNEMRVIPVTGGNPRTLRRAGAGSYMLPQCWSPDSKQLLVSNFLPDGTSQLALISVQDGSIRSLKTIEWQHFNASFSPDGKLIAYDARAGEKSPSRDIFVLAVDGKQEIAAVQNMADDSAPVWSPDGSRILFLSNRTGHSALWSVPLVDRKPGKEELVKADLGTGRIWITRSGTLYYVTPGPGGPNIYSAELSADMKVSKAPVLAVDTFVNSNSTPALSPDGEYLAYRSNRAGSNSLVIRTLKTGEERVVPTQVPLGNIFAWGPRWFPGGESLLILSLVPQGPGPSFYRIDRASGKAELLLHSQGGVYGFRLSADGKTIFYGDGHRLLRFDIETRQETELKTGEKTGEYFYADVSVSPDGKQLAYEVSLGNGPASYIAVMPAAGGASRELFRGPWGGVSRFNALVWTPDQKYLLFPKDGAAANVLWRVPVAGGPAEQAGLSMPGLWDVQLHPDGRRIFFTASESGPSEIWTLENFLPQAAGK
jgi:Tol biopolymer transport system component